MLHITATEIVQVLGISKSTLDRWYRQGEIPRAAQAPGPRGGRGWRRWPAAPLAAALKAKGFAVPAAWCEGSGA